MMLRESTRAARNGACEQRSNTCLCGGAGECGDERQNGSWLNRLEMREPCVECSDVKRWNKSRRLRNALQHTISGVLATVPQRDATAFEGNAQ
mgnify:CR=1 FL=1